MKQLDLSLYLVTDSGMLPPGKTLPQVVDEAIQGGVTVVQLREKSADTGNFIATARLVQAVTRRANVPLLINDRLDVALAIDADGVHIGQDDIPLEEARSLLGPDKIIGVSVQTRKEAEDAVAGGADYLGIGTCYSTTTKQVKEGPQGPAGIRDVWERALEASSHTIRAVTIGGINQFNAAHVMNYSAAFDGKVPLNGIAVVSAIMASPTPRLAAQELKRQLSTSSSLLELRPHRQLEQVKQLATEIFAKLRSTTPLVQHITNMVVINDCANACLALGGSPVMSSESEEQADLSAAVSSLVVNTGTLTSAQIEGMRSAMKHANLHNTPITLDPVAVGATGYRSQIVSQLLCDFRVSVIKGNAGEIGKLAGSKEVQMRGVDAVGSGFACPEKIAQQVALRHRCVVVMTGAEDYVSDGINTFVVQNGHKMQGQITGSGCMVGTAIGTFMHAALACKAPLVGALVGIVAINLAAEHAARRPDVRGPGTFRAAFIDEMHNLTLEQFQAEMKIKQL
ncbi:thiamine biosynthetic bifunctional enzyme [Coemansia brasiliensis]|uniref:Thiamine biosynthetic bifunctional enzyme n=1 Tax=Coemansia brasiliensis TaxID=2650707 RepID=A0A9W8IFZ6_9FUNG|nr:thiamine biosynthetic bifunctional enzyme [Coemansia brasiliensis]